MAIIREATSYHTALEQDENENWWDAVSDFGQYGITGAITSGALSIVNTGKALGNVFGGDFEYTETGDVLDNFGWEETANYYRENKALVDGVGFVATAFVPGMAGVKAARMAQSGLAKSGAMANKAVGLRGKTVNALRTTLVPKKAQERMYANLKQNANYYDSSYRMYRDAVGKGFHQQAVENLFAETAILATMNQSPLLTGKDLDYFGAINENLGSAAFGFAFGTGITGIMDSAVTYTSMKGLLKNDAKMINEMMDISRVDSKYAQMQNVSAGDRIAIASAQEHQAREAVKVLHNRTTSGEATDRDHFLFKKAKAALDEYDRQYNDYFKQLTQSYKKAGVNQGSTNFLRKAMKKLHSEVEPQARGELFSGMERVTIYGEENALFSPKAHRLSVLSNDDLPNYFKEEVLGVTDGRPLTAMEQAELDDFVKTTSIRETPDGRLYGTYGAAFTKLPRVGAFVNKRLLDGNNRQRALYTIRHELGHMNSDRIATVFETKYGGVVKKQVEQLSRMGRPDRWQQLDSLSSQIDFIKQTKSLDELTEADIDALAELEDQFNRINIYMNKPQELLADATAMLSNPDTVEELAKRFPDAYAVLENNQAVMAKVGKSEKLVDLQTKELFDVTDRVPTLADLGTVDKRGKIVHVSGPNNRSFSLVDEFDPRADDMNPLKASAHYWDAINNPITKGNISIKEHELNKFIKVLQGAKSTSESGERFIPTITLKLDDGTTRTFDFKKSRANDITPDDRARYISELRGFMNKSKVKLIKDLTSKGKYSEDEIARLVDIDLSSVKTRGYDMKSEMSWSEVRNPSEPTVAKVLYKNENLADGRVGENELRSTASSIARAEESAKLATTVVDSYLTKLFGNDPAIVLPDTVDNLNTRAYGDITDFDSANGFAVSFQADYDSLGAVKAVGVAHSKLDDYGLQRIDNEVATSARRLQQDSEGLAEMSALDSRLRQDKFYEQVVDVEAKDVDVMKQLHESLVGEPAKDTARLEKLSTVASALKARAKSGRTMLMSEELRSEITSALTIKRLPSSRISHIEEILERETLLVQNESVDNFYRSYNRANQMVIDADEAVAVARGKTSGLNRDVWYPGPINRQRYKYIMYVTPKVKGIMGDNKPAMIGAPTAEGLEAQIQKVRDAFGEDVAIRNADEQKQFFKDSGVYDEELALSEFNVNSAMKRKGVLWDIASEPTPQLVDDMINGVKQQWRGKTKQLMRARYNREFAALESMDSLQSQASRSLQGVSEKDRGITKAQELMNIMLNITDSGRFTQWVQSQEALDKAFSKMFNGITGMFKSATTPVDFEAVNKYRRQNGLPDVFDDNIKDYVMQTENVNERILSTTIPKLNAAAGTMMLRLDLIQPVINTLSLPILAVPEMKHLMDALPELQRREAEKLLQVGHVGELGKGKVEYSNTRLMYGAAKNWFNKDIRAEYDKLGLIDNIAKEFHDSLDGISVTAKELGDDVTISNRVKKVADLLSKPADTTESFVRFMAANMADQVMKRAGITSPSIRSEVMRTYVDRVIGNYTYAQRPQLFQGFAGQAIGLFQTYQFNLIQQLLRHMGTDKRRAAALMGIQGGIFGAQSVPGFELLNNHIAERSEGDYQDFYTAADDMFGDELSQWLMYGAGSNFTKPITGDGLALYTRGNLNPRSATIIPTSLEEVPAYSMTTRFIDSVGTMADNIASGAPVSQSFFQAMATNGLNRPLAGLGQMLAGARTTRDGNMLFALHDLDAWSRAVRLAGTQTLNEAVAVEAFYRTKKFAAAKQDKINSMAGSAREMFRAGNFDSNKYMEFMREYTRNGGSYDYFERWVHNQALGATQSQIQELYRSNTSEEGLYLQRVLGADVQETFSSAYMQSRLNQPDNGNGEE